MFKSCITHWYISIWMVCCLVVQKFVHAGIREDIDLSAVDHIKKNGYPVEIYSNITTEDGYLLDIYRIPHGKIQKKRRSQNPVLMVHGLWRSSLDWVSMGPERGLAYLLADRGYDVWLINERGSIYSRKHLTLNADSDPDFWAFSFHEIGLYDLPATFSLMRNVTNRERLACIGVSEGATVFYVLTSLKSEYNYNMTIMISLGPIVHLGHNNNPLITLLARFEPLWAPLARLIGIYDGSQTIELLHRFNKYFCTIEGFFQAICATGVFLLGGNDPAQLNVTTLPLIIAGSGTGSLRQFQHFAQNVNSGLFRQFDYERRVNLKIYGTPQPPSYNLTKVTSPNAIFYSDGDVLSNTLDAEMLCAKLANCVYKYKVPWKEFNHFDFVIAKDVINLVYNKVFYILEKYNYDNNK